MPTFEAVCEKLIQTADSMAVQVAREAAKYTAFDVRTAAQRSIKSGGKNKRSKNWSFSKPGEPPKSHLGTLKNAIRFEANGPDAYLIGPERVGASSALKSLEYGGTGTFRETDYNANYVAKKRRRTRARSFDSREIRCRVHGTLRTSRPRAVRPYYVYSKELGKGAFVRDYRYFYSQEEWLAATKAPAFQRWANDQRRTTTTTVKIDARPFMRPALAAQTTEQKNAARMTRAARKFTN